MYFIIFLFCGLSASAGATTLADNDVAYLGRDAFCFFAYSRWAKPSNIHENFPSAQRIGVARLPYHRLDFYYYLDEAKGSLPTMVPDCGYEVWGAIYSIPIEDLNLVLTKGGLAGDKRVFHFVQKIIETYSNGNTIYLKCNAFEQIVLPEKLIYGLPLPQDRRPSRSILNNMIDAFKDAGLPTRYIEEISQLPTREQSADLMQSPNRSIIHAPNFAVHSQNYKPIINDDDDDDDDDN